MQETGTLDRLWKKVEINIKRENNAPKIQDANALGYENVSVPFSALLGGVFAAILILGIEAVVFCKAKYADDVYTAGDEDFNSKEAANIIYEINELLLEHQSKLKDMRLLYKIKTLASTGTSYANI